MTSGPESSLLRAEQGRKTLKPVDPATPGDHYDHSPLLQTRELKSKGTATPGATSGMFNIFFYVKYNKYVVSVVLFYFTDPEINTERPILLLCNHNLYMRC